MSQNSNNRPAFSHERAERIIREILNSNDPPETISPSGELYRLIDRYHSQRGRQNQAAGNAEMPPDPDPERRRRPRESNERSTNVRLSSPPLSAATHSLRRISVPGNSSSSQSPSTWQTPRERAVARLAGMNARRSRQRMMNERLMVERGLEAVPRDLTNGLADLQSAGIRLEQASSSLRALLDTPFPHSEQENPRHVTSFAHPQHEDEDDLEMLIREEEGRRSKRRKLESDAMASERMAFRYGRYGQVEPGRLNMEIVSCDGGIYEQKEINYAAENVLRNDDTVYCTKSNRCNLVLQHQGATVFDLKELIIKAPHTGYTAPVQEGMVFVSMTSDDLLTRTAQYQIQYSPPRDRRSASERACRAPVTIRHNIDGTMTGAQAGARRLYQIAMMDDDCDNRTAQIPPDFTSMAPPFQVTTECSDSEDEDGSPRSPSMPPLRRTERSTSSESESADEANHWRPTPNMRARTVALLEDESGGSITRLPPGNMARSIWRGGSAEREPRSTVSYRAPARTRTQSGWNPDPEADPAQDSDPDAGPEARIRRRETASNITLAEAEESAQIATQEAVRAVGGELMVPHARFFIERDKSKVTVRFEPPVSGRFILLKMWSPHHTPSGNIDVQSVVCKGFAGPRFFPDVTMR